MSTWATIKSSSLYLKTQNMGKLKEALMAWARESHRYNDEDRLKKLEGYLDAGKVYDAFLMLEFRLARTNNGLKIEQFIGDNWSWTPCDFLPYLGRHQLLKSGGRIDILVDESWHEKYQMTTRGLRII